MRGHASLCPPYDRRVFGKQFRSQTRLRSLAAQFARALLDCPPSCPRGRREGRVLTSHPRSAARKCSARRTAQQHTGGANHSAFPAQWVDGLCRALPGAEFVLASLASRIDDVVDPVGRSTPPRKLDRSNDGQDHTVLPYARPACSQHYLPALSTLPRECWRDEPNSAARRHEASGSRRAIRPALSLSRPALPRPPQPGSRAARHTIAPQGRAGMNDTYAVSEFR